MQILLLRTDIFICTYIWIKIIFINYIYNFRDQPSKNLWHFCKGWTHFRKVRQNLKVSLFTRCKAMTNVKHELASYIYASIERNFSLTNFAIAWTISCLSHSVARPRPTCISQSSSATLWRFRQKDVSGTTQRLAKPYTFHVRVLRARASGIYDVVKYADSREFQCDASHSYLLLGVPLIAN